MALENPTYVGDLNQANPDGADSRTTADDHIRNLKKSVKNTLAGFAGGVVCTGTDGGAVNAYTVTPTNSLPSYTARLSVVFSPTATNTSTATINVSGLGAKNIKRIDGSDLVAGDLVSGSIYVAIYTGTEFRLMAPTKNYIDQLAFSTALPAQPGSATQYFLSTSSGVASWEVVLPPQSGNSGKYLTTDGSTASWGSPPALVLLSTASASSSAVVDFAAAINSSYEEYWIELINVIPATNNVAFWLRTSIDGGASFDSGAANYVYNSARMDVVTANNSTGDTKINLTPNNGVFSTAARGGISGWVRIFNPASTTTYKSVMWGITYPQDATTGIICAIGSGERQSTSAVNAIRFLMSSGSISSGAFKLYGMRKAV